MTRMTSSDQAFHGIIVVLLIMTALTMLLPFLNLLAVSFSSAKPIVNHEVFLLPKDFQLHTYEYVITSPQMLKTMLNTVYITVVGTFISVLSTALLGYGLSKRYIVIRAVALQLIVFTMLFKPGIIPTYLVVKGTGLINSRWALMIPGAINAFNLIVMMTFFRGLPEEIEESAVIDGAGAAVVFFRIVVPLSMPGIATITLFYAVARWNTFFSAVMYLNDMSKYPLQVFLREIIIVGTSLEESQSLESEVQNLPSENIKAATIMFATFPILIVYPFLQKYFVKGAMIGSIKG